MRREGAQTEGMEEGVVRVVELKEVQRAEKVEGETVETAARVTHRKSRWPM